MPAVIPTNAKKLIAIHVASVADAVNTLDGVSQSAVAIPKLLEAFLRIVVLEWRDFARSGSIR